jgi:Domain of unknown function (DUF4291)
VSVRPAREVRAVFDDQTVRVYQAYSPAIAEPAVAAQRFVAPFKRSRMTWIKPSFTWMMYRSGWGKKEGQERVLAIDLSREGFESALSRACLSHFEPALHPDPEAWRTQLAEAPVRVQWDPERDLRLVELPYRSLQVGLSAQAVESYVDHWIVRIQDVTTLAHEISSLLSKNEYERAATLRPEERPYPLPAMVAARIGASGPQP